MTLLERSDLVIQVHPPPGDDREELFRRTCSDYPDRKIEQDAEGNIWLMPPAANESSDRNAELIRQLANWTRLDRRGRVFDSNTVFRLPDASLRGPDAAWISKQQLVEVRRRQPRDAFLSVVPDFVIELQSATDQSQVLQEKCRQWAKNGALLVWLINPYTKTVTIYTHDGGIEEVVNADSVNGTGPVAGFTLALEEIWEPDWSVPPHQL